MNTAFERIKQGKEEWLTPKYIIDALGKFDLDPCSPIHRPWPTAHNHYTIEDDGLSTDWKGRVWLTYSKKEDTLKVCKCKCHTQQQSDVLNAEKNYRLVPSILYQDLQDHLALLHGVESAFLSTIKKGKPLSVNMVLGKGVSTNKKECSNVLDANCYLRQLPNIFGKTKNAATALLHGAKHVRENMPELPAKNLVNRQKETSVSSNKRRNIIFRKKEDFPSKSEATATTTSEGKESYPSFLAGLQNSGKNANVDGDINALAAEKVRNLLKNTSPHLLRQIVQGQFPPICCPSAKDAITANAKLPAKGYKKSFLTSRACNHCHCNLSIKVPLRIWMNPPYGNKTGEWLKKLSEYGNGIALIFARTETKMFFDYIWPKADAIMFLKGRLKFYNVDGTIGNNTAGAPSCLIAYGNNNALALIYSDLIGKYIKLK